LACESWGRGGERQLQMKEQAGNTFSPMAELSVCPSDPAWYCIRSHLKHEHIAAAHLRLLPGVEVFNPRLRVLRATRRGRVRSTESLFPNYVFARFILESRLEAVRFTNAVAAVVQFGDTVPAIPETTIRQLQTDLDNLESKV